MLRKILSLVLNCEKDSKKTGDRKTITKERTIGEGRSEESISSIHVGSTQEKIPDPWF